MEQVEHQYVTSIVGEQKKSNFLKNILLILAFANGILCASVLTFILLPQIVILEKDGLAISYQGERKEIVITQDEIKKMAQDFIKARYEWDQFDLDQKLDELTSFTTPGLKEKLELDFKKNLESFKVISQYVGKLELNTHPNGVIDVKFDKILRLTAKPQGDDASALSSMPEKIPLLSQTQVQLQIARGKKLPSNPLGIYVNALTEYGSN